MIRCPLCIKRFKDEETLEKHIEKKHPEQLGEISPAQFLFNLRNKKDHGECIMKHKVNTCFVNTKFNDQTKKYARICENPQCKKDYVEEFRQRMTKKYGKPNLLSDPDVQRKMLTKRSISGEYKWDDKMFSYVGSYEKEFLDYMFLFLEWPSSDIISPAPFNVEYRINGEDKFYIPDFYIPSIGLVVEIKGSNNHYQKRDKETELAKDKAMIKSKEFNYIKITDKKYSKFLDGLLKRKWSVK